MRQKRDLQQCSHDSGQAAARPSGQQSACLPARRIGPEESLAPVPAAATAMWSDAGGKPDPLAGPSDQELIRMIQSLPRESPERESACETLLVRHRPVVWSCVQRYRHSPEPDDDLMQVGYVGLLKAISRFDPAIGSNLAAYAQAYISGEIKRHFRDKRWQVRVRRSAQDLRLELRQASCDLTQQLSRFPRASELASYLQVSEAAVIEAQEADSLFQVSSLDAPLPASDGAAALADFLGADDPGIERTINMQSVAKHWMELPARQRRLLLMRFYDGMTQAEIGEELKISQMHVSRLLARALAYLRDRLGEPGQQAACTAGGPRRRARSGVAPSG